MARRKRSDRRSGVSSTPNRTVAVSPLVSPLRSLVRPILDLEDRRLHHPLGAARNPRSVFRSDVRLVEAPSKRFRAGKRSSLSVAKPFGAETLSFAVPQRVSICVRRKQRREVLFAVRRTGKGAKSIRRRRNQWSEIKC